MRPALFALLLLGCGYQPSPFAPIAEAARGGDVTAVRDLVRRGADPNALSGQNGWTPLEHAIHTHQLASMNALLDAGADPNRPDANGTTPLMMAAAYGYNDMVEALLRRGANPRAVAPDGIRAVDLAMTGVADIDRFTLFECQDQTVRTLRNAAPSTPVNPRARAWARIKGC